MDRLTVATLVEVVLRRRLALPGFHPPRPVGLRRPPVLLCLPAAPERSLRRRRLGEEGAALGHEEDRVPLLPQEVVLEEREVAEIRLEKVVENVAKDPWRVKGAKNVSGQRES